MSSVGRINGVNGALLVIDASAAEARRNQRETVQSRSDAADQKLAAGLTRNQSDLEANKAQISASLIRSIGGVMSAVRKIVGYALAIPTAGVSTYIAGAGEAVQGRVVADVAGAKDLDAARAQRAAMRASVLERRAKSRSAASGDQVEDYGAVVNRFDQLAIKMSNWRPE